MTEQPTEQPEERHQSVEDTMARLAGVPRTEEEVKADAEALEAERVAKNKIETPEPGPEPGPTPPPEPAPEPPATP